MDPRMGRRRAAVTRARGRRRLRVLIGLLVLSTLGTGTLALLHSPWMAVRHLQVSGSQHTPVSEVRAVARLNASTALVDVNSVAVEAHLEALPWVKTALVSRHWPDTVRIAIVERVPAALAAGGGAHQGQWALVDDSGRVLAYAPSPLAGLPQLESPAAVGAPGTALGPSARAGLAVIGALPGQLPTPVRAVTVAANGWVSLQLAGGTEVALGPPQMLEAKLSALRSVLVEAPPPGPELIDVTVPGEPTVGPEPS